MYNVSTLMLITAGSELTIGLVAGAVWRVQRRRPPVVTRTLEEEAAHRNRDALLINLLFAAMAVVPVAINLAWIWLKL